MSLVESPNGGTLPRQVERGAMEAAYAVVRLNYTNSELEVSTDVIDIWSSDDGTATLVKNTSGKTFRMMSGDVQPIVTTGWRKSTVAPFRATHPLYLNR